MAKNNILTFNFTIDKNFKAFLRKPVNEGEVKRFANDIDKVMFGKEGELSKMIENQAWKPLSAEWRKYKEEHIGQKVRSFPPPNKCISSDIWVYTGKTKKEGEMKKMKHVLCFAVFSVLSSFSFSSCGEKKTNGDGSRVE